MKTTTANNRTSVTFEINAFGNEFVEKSNAVTAICKKYNAQENIYSNQSHLKFDNKANVIGFQNGWSGGTVTFHEHSCDHKAAAAELVALLESFGMKLTGTFQEVTRTHRENGTAYKMPQVFIEAIK